jgi:membrane-bound lytic murein transglycosylase D
MNKLLLLATSLICLSMRGYSAEGPFHISGATFVQTAPDSSIKDDLIHAAKGNFQDLFDDDFNNGVAVVKLNPKAVSFVQDYIESDGSRLNNMKGRAKPFFDKINTIFTAQGLPVELKYLAVIESDLKTSATSRVGAAGPWQFMSQTARELGLKVNKSVDERRDFSKSTRAAARYLGDLYSVYNDWLLVIAAYNCGPGVVNTAIRKSGSRNFWDIQYNLPAESRNHVKKFIATHYIMEGDLGLTTLTKKETDALLQGDRPAPAPGITAQSVTGKYNSIAITQQIQMTLTEFNKLNPNFDKALSANGSYELRLPDEKMNLFHAEKQQILENSIRLMMGNAGL